MKKRLITTLIIFQLILLQFTTYAQTHISTQKHQTSVSNIVTSQNNVENSFFSTSQDGFIIKWNEENKGERYQLTDLPIQLVAVSPDEKTIAIYETDGGVINRVSVWDFTTLKRKYAKRFTNPLTSLSFSANGTYIIAGSATVDSIIFIRTVDGSIINKLKESTGIISYISTSASEKTLFLYSPVGNISYFGISDGKLKQKLQCEQNLVQVTTFNNDMFLIGTKNNYIYIISAITGKTITSFASRNAIITTNKNDKDAYYLVNNNMSGYVLMSLETIENKYFAAPKTIKNFKSLPKETINCGAKLNNKIMLGSTKGNIFETDLEINTTTQSFTPITNDTYTKILDIENIANDIYFLTDDAIYKSYFDINSQTTIEKIAYIKGQTNITKSNAGIVLWSKGTRKTVQLIDLQTKEITSLFTPTSNIQKIKPFDNFILELEGNSNINLYSFETKKIERLYIGAGLQDAVIIGDTLYIAKSSVTNPQSPLISVNIKTKEVVQLTVNGDVIYALNSLDDKIYGINIQANNETRTTQIFEYAPTTNKIKMLLKLNDEDINAFIYLFGNNIFTDIGRTQIYSYSTLERKSIIYNRSISLPIKLLQNNSLLVSLNKDGSISWYNIANKNVITNWYLTQEKTWYEF